MEDSWSSRHEFFITVTTLLSVELTSAREFSTERLKGRVSSRADSGSPASWNAASGWFGDNGRSSIDGRVGDKANFLEPEKGSMVSRLSKSSR
jgi:hypothetical protein